MKRIEFIAPVEAIRGNLSGRQDLRYAENDNPAYDAPVGQVNYARNYTPRFIGAKRSATGQKYFQVRTKSAVHLTLSSKKSMAVMGGTGAIVAKILKADPITLTPIYHAWLNYLENGGTSSFRKYLTDAIMGRVRGGIEIIIFAAPTGTSVSMRNPWYDGTQTDGLKISQEVLVKFWDELCPNGKSFYIDESKQIAMADHNFDDWMGDILDFIGFHAVSIGGVEYVGTTTGGMYLKNSAGNFVKPDDAIVANARYYLTSEIPS